VHLVSSIISVALVHTSPSSFILVAQWLGPFFFFKFQDIHHGAVIVIPSLYQCYCARTLPKPVPCVFFVVFRILELACQHCDAEAHCERVVVEQTWAACVVALESCSLLPQCDQRTLLEWKTSEPSVERLKASADVRWLVDAWMKCEDGFSVQEWSDISR
jgi:hypothetical protein